MIDITTNVREVIEKIGRIPQKMENATKPVLRNTAEKFRRIMSRPGLAVRYPINWDSLKQKIYVISKLKREGNLPYERTNAHVSGWKTENTSVGTTVSNIGHKAAFLYGTASGIMEEAQKVQPSGQSHIFAGRWPLTNKVLVAVLSRFPEELLQALRIAVND